MNVLLEKRSDTNVTRSCTGDVCMFVCAYLWLKMKCGSDNALSYWFFHFYLIHFIEAFKMRD